MEGQDVGREGEEVKPRPGGRSRRRNGEMDGRV